MTYVHCHLGKVPPYLLDSMESIHYVESNSRIILITDQSIEIDGIQIVELNQIISPQTEKVMRMKLFSNDPNPLWRTSIFRIFLIRDAFKYLNLKYCYHFDSDVLLFQSSSKFENMISNFDGLYITPCNSDELVFGFSRIGSYEKINEICNILYDIIFDNEKMKKYYVSMPNEMQLLCGIFKERPDLIQKLPIIPFGNEDVIFDPSSYGQYFGGTDQGNPPGFSHHTHIIGREIQSGKLTPIMKDKKPYAVIDGKEYPIVNLHIHSKNTKSFL